MRIIERELFDRVSGAGTSVQAPVSSTYNGNTLVEVFDTKSGGTLAIICTNVSASLSLGINSLGKLVPITGSITYTNSTCKAITYDANGNKISTTEISAADVDNGDVTVASNGAISDSDPGGTTTTSDSGSSSGDSGDSGDDGGDGGGDNEGCVATSSVLPGGILAGDITVGSTMQLADERTMAPGIGTVTYSRRKTVQGFRITTKSGVTLVCSDTAPIPTREGLVLAPNLLGKEVPVRVDSNGVSESRWEEIVAVDNAGTITVQHITVGDKCFWAGEVAGRYILHHNLKDTDGDDEG